VLFGYAGRSQVHVQQLDGNVAHFQLEHYAGTHLHGPLMYTLLVRARAPFYLQLASAQAMLDAVRVAPGSVSAFVEVRSAAR